MRGLSEVNRVFELVGEKLLPDLSTRTLSQAAGERLTRARLKKLVSETGALKTITCLDFVKLRVHNMFMFLSVRDKSHKFDLFKELCSLPFAARVSCVSGSDTDFIILFRTDKYQHIAGKIYPALEKHRRILDVKGAYLSQLPAYDLLHMYPKEPGKAEKTDLIDWKIISEIKEDALKSAKEIANNIGVSEHTVRERIDKMERKGIIKGYLIVKVWDKFPSKHVPITNIIGIAGKERDLKEVFERVIRSNAFKLFLYRVYGKYDFIGGFRVGSMLDLQKLIKRLSGRGVRTLDNYILFDMAFPNWARSVVEYWK